MLRQILDWDKLNIQDCVNDSFVTPWNKRKHLHSVFRALVLSCVAGTITSIQIRCNKSFCYIENNNKGLILYTELAPRVS